MGRKMVEIRVECEIDNATSNDSVSLKGKLNRDNYHFYLASNHNKEIFHINELLLSHGGFIPSGVSSIATLHIDNRTDMSIFPAFFNECKRVANNLDNLFLAGVTLIYSLNACLIVNWLLDFPSLLECADSRENSLLAASFYFLLFLIIPLFCSFLFTAQPLLNENGVIALLPWKPLNKVRIFGPIYG